MQRIAVLFVLFVGISTAHSIPEGPPRDQNANVKTTITIGVYPPLALPDLQKGTEKKLEDPRAIALLHCKAKDGQIVESRDPSGDIKIRLEATLQVLDDTTIIGIDYKTIRGDKPTSSLIRQFETPVPQSGLWYMVSDDGRDLYLVQCTVSK